MNERSLKLLLLSIFGFLTLLSAVFYIILVVLFPPAATSIPIIGTFVIPGTGGVLFETVIIPVITILFATLGLLGFVTSAFFYFKSPKPSHPKSLLPIVDATVEELTEHQHTIYQQETVQQENVQQEDQSDDPPQRSWSPDDGREIQEAWREMQEFLDANPDQDYAKIIDQQV